MIKKGFTLAEVLITLSIIGVVAALTIPVLSRKIEDTKFKTAAKKAYSSAAQAVMNIKQDNGGTLSGLFDNGGSFSPAFRKYFKVIRNCSPACVAPSNASDVYKSLSGNGLYTWYMDDGQFVTADGMFWGFENCGVTHAVYNGFIGMTVDVNGYEKKPNVLGRDTFVFELIDDQLLPSGAPGTKSPKNVLPPDQLCDKNVSNNLQGWGCMAKVLQGIDY